MLKELAVKQLKAPFYSFKSQNSFMALFPIFIFLILNTLKITLFNYFIIPAQTLGTFNYKLVMTMLMTIIICPLFFKFRTSIPFIIIYALQIIYIFANMSYYLFYHNYVHVLQWVTLFKEAFLSAGHSAAPMDYKMLIILLDIPAFAYIIFNYSKIAKINSKIRIPRIYLTITALIIIALIEINNFTHAYSLVQFSKDSYRGEYPIVERYGTLTNNIVKLYLNRGENGYEKKLVYGTGLSNKIASSSKPNFVIIQVESMDSNIINQQHQGQYITPFLHSLAAKNIYYPYVMSYHMGGGTSDSEFSIINSVEPLPDYPAIKLANYKYPNSLMKKLNTSAYKTLAFHGNVAEFYDRDIAFPKMGFGSFFDINKMNFENSGWGAPDGEVFDFSIKKLKATSQPFLSYTITMTSHTNFTSASNYYNNELYNDIDDEITKGYFNSMSYVDKSLEAYVKQIQANFKNTYIFIWGDHTPNIETDIYKQASFSSDNKYFEFVPLIIVTPNHKVYTEQTKVASFVDIAPTILYASKTKFDFKSSGQDLINSPRKNNKILFKGDEYDRTELYNQLINPVEPSEK
jgi:lipoteichoic acid synthase